MSIWFRSFSLEELQKLNAETMVSHCGIEITEILEDGLCGKMPVDDRTRQPMGLLHGGANCVLAETLGSVAANMCCDTSKENAVGLNISTRHIKSVNEGWVRGVARSVQLGRKVQQWEINTYSESGQLTSTTQLTMMIVPRKN